MEPSPGPLDVEAREVETAAEADAAGRAAWEAFDLRPERRNSAAEVALFEELHASDAGAVYAAWLGGRLVGSGRAFFSSRGVLLSGGSTVPDARGRGVYSALVRARWDAAVARGTPALVVQAGSMSEPILRGLGFEQACRFRRLEDVLEPA